MVNGYYRHAEFYRAQMVYEDIKYDLKEKDYGFLGNLSEKERELGRIIFNYFLEESGNYIKAKKYKTSDLKEFCNQDTEFMIRDENGVPYNCKLVCSKAGIIHAYFNASHDYFEGYKAVQAVQIQKVGEGELETSKGLSKLFEGLRLSTGASINCSEEDQFLISEMTPDIWDLKLISRGLSVKKTIEQFIRDCERKEKEERKAREAEDEGKREIEESMEEEGMIEYYESKVGKVTPTLRGIKSQIINNKNAKNVHIINM